MQGVNPFPFKRESDHDHMFNCLDYLKRIKTVAMDNKAILDISEEFKVCIEKYMMSNLERRKK